MCAPRGRFSRFLVRPVRPPCSPADTTAGREASAYGHGPCGPGPPQVAHRALRGSPTRHGSPRGPPSAGRPGRPVRGLAGCHPARSACDDAEACGDAAVRPHHSASRQRPWQQQLRQHWPRGRPRHRQLAPFVLRGRGTRQPAEAPARALAERPRPTLLPARAARSAAHFTHHFLQLSRPQMYPPTFDDEQAARALQWTCFMISLILAMFYFWQVRIDRGCSSQPASAGTEYLRTVCVSAHSRASPSSARPCPSRRAPRERWLPQADVGTHADAGRVFCPLRSTTSGPPSGRVRSAASPSPACCCLESDSVWGRHAEGPKAALRSALIEDAAVLPVEPPGARSGRQMLCLGALPLPQRLPG